MMLFNRRNDLAREFEKWAEENKLAKSAVNVIILERTKNETVETEGTINRLVKTAKELFEKDWVRKGWIRDVAERACKAIEEESK